MSAAPAYVYGQTQLQPAYNPEDARQINVNLAAGTYLRGTLLGQVTDTEADAVQTLTTSGTVTAGTFVLTGQPLTSGSPISATLNWNATVALVQAALDTIYGAGNTIASGTALPAGSVAITFRGALAAQPVAAITHVDTLTGGALVVTQTTPGVANTGTFGAYVHGNSDGTQVAKGLLMYPCVVDASGNITVGGDIPTLTDTETPMYYMGSFRTEELVGLPTGAQMAVDFPGARVIIGDLVSGVLVLAG